MTCDYCLSDPMKEHRLFSYFTANSSIPAVFDALITAFVGLTELWLFLLVVLATIATATLPINTAVIATTDFSTAISYCQLLVTTTTAATTDICITLLVIVRVIFCH